MQIITSTGFGDSGSSAITHLLSEYNNISLFNSNWECTFLHSPFGLADLENAIKEAHRLKVDYAISKFLELSKNLSKNSYYKEAFNNNFYKISQNFIEDLALVKWDGFYEDKNDYYNTISKKGKKYIDFASTYYNFSKKNKISVYEGDNWLPSYIPSQNMYYQNDINRFYECARTYIKNLINEISSSNENIYLDQFLPPISLKKYLNYMPYPTKVFLVDKDPRDLFIIENIHNGSRFVPFKDVEVFIKWYRATRNKAKEDILNENKYFCTLDDLIYDYENQCTKIQNFLGFTEKNHINPYKYFNPKKSYVNIRLYKKYNNFTNEIKRIEEELPEFLCNNNTESFNFEPKKNELITVKYPIRDTIIECDKIQNGIINHKKFTLALYSTMLIKNISNFCTRKSILKKLKGIIKIIAGVFLFIPQFIINLIYILGAKKC